MIKFPAARSAEFEGLFVNHPLAGGESALDFPAGGATRQTPGLLSHDHLAGGQAGFSDTTDVLQVEEPGRLHGFDHADSLAALHHFEDAIDVMQRLLRTLDPGGLLHVADMAAGYPLCEFLDGFVGRYYVTGHQGRYLDRDPVSYASLGRITRREELSCAWRFDDEDGMLAFCMNLFGLVDCLIDGLRDALQRLVGFRTTRSGMELDWLLLYPDIAT